MKKIIIVLLVWVLIYWYIQYSWYQNFLTQEIDSIDNNTIEIPAWAVASKFLVDEFWMNENYVKAYFKLNDVDASLEAGKFKITPPITIQNFFDKLDNPVIDGDVDLVIIEWNTIFDIDYCLSNPSEMASSQGWKKWCIFDRTWEDEVLIAEPYANKWAFYEYATSADTVNTLKSSYSFLEWAETLEGFLHPDSYKINKNTFSVEVLVKKMLDNFDRKVMQDSELIAEFWSSLAGEVADNIIIASIVEKEIASPTTREEDEAEKVAWVLKKRYEENWQIWADATVCYPYEILSKDCTPSFVLEKLYDVTEYNTRQMTGLPRTPISNPFAATIKSTLLSKESQYYYYLHAPDGKIYYAKDNAWHESNKQQYLR